MSVQCTRMQIHSPCMLSWHVLRLYICLAVTEGNTTKLTKCYGTLGCDVMHLATWRHIQTHRTLHIHGSYNLKLHGNCHLAAIKGGWLLAQLCLYEHLKDSGEFSWRVSAQYCRNIQGIGFRVHVPTAYRPILCKADPSPPTSTENASASPIPHSIHDQDVVLNEVQAQIQHCHHSIHNCPAHENWIFRRPHELSPLQLRQCAVRPIELRVTLATTNRFWPTVP